MKVSRILKLSFDMVMHSKLRSWLTILGIFIGIAAVVGIISVGQGLQQNVNSNIQGLGQDIITISSGSSRAFSGGFEGSGGGGRGTTKTIQLSDKDIQALKLVSGIKSINGIVSGRATIKYQSQNTSVNVQGWDPLVFGDFMFTPLTSGRYLQQGDAGVVVVGNSLASNVFNNPLNLGYVISINDKPFRIVGILAPSSGFSSSDNGIYMSSKDARNVLNNTLTLGSGEYSSLQVRVMDVNYVNETTTSIQAAMDNSHHVLSGKEDFSISSPLALQQRFSAITSGITLFLAVIAAVSLIVGGIGVANTMFTSVVERTRDIGVMKAIGAKNSDILLLFLFSSGMLGLVGGILGILGGAGISYLLPSLGLSIGIGRGAGGTLSTVISPGLLIFSMIFSIAIGMISGVIPAYRASKLKPVDALRYE